MAKRQNPVQELQERTKSRLLVGIYIRVSSEVQAEKASPDIQEADCRKHCEANGYTVVDVYRDTAAYRVGRKLVQPSGTRVDRPQLQRMLADARSGRINCIVAWKEDRLYRGFRPMLEVLDTLEELKGLLRIELAKENFDPNLAPIKAWMARMELQAKNDRWHLGMQGRLAAGKVITGSEIYGYNYNPQTGLYSENPDESKWLRKIWGWYGDGLKIPEIRERLISSGAPQKRSVSRSNSKSPWSAGVILTLIHRDCYATGQKATNLAGQDVWQAVPVIIDQATAKCVMERKKASESYRTKHRMEHEYTTAWCAGLVYCAGDQWKMSCGYNYQDGRFLPYYEYYRCTHEYHHGGSPQDPKHIPVVVMSWLDRYVWNAIYQWLSDPAFFEARIEERVEQLRASQQNNQENRQALVDRVEALREERRRVTVMYRKKYINDDELGEQMGAIEAEEAELQSDLAQTEDGYGEEIDRLVELARTYRERMAAGIVNLQYEPTDPNKFRTWSDMVKGIIQALVLRVEVDSKYSVKILTHVDLMSPIPANHGGDVSSQGS